MCLLFYNRPLKASIKESVIFSDSNYAQYSFVSNIILWKENSMKNGREKDIKKACQ